MRKSILFISTLFFIISSKSALAQTFDATKAYQDYQYALEVYNQANTSFTDAKDFYLTNKTLTLKEDARRKLLVMLRGRDQLEIVYLTALKMKILEVKGLTNDTKNNIFAKIDNEINWHKDHMNNYKDSDPLEDLFNKSDESESKYKTTTSLVIYESLFNISLGEEVGIRQDHEDIYANLKSIINAGVTSGKLDMNPFNRWFTDIESTITTLKQNEDLSKTQIQKLYEQNSTDYSPYYNAIQTLTFLENSLTQLNSFLTEVNVSIRNQQ